jgi:phosphotransferase system enzyme I (PtsP)
VPVTLCGEIGGQPLEAMALIGLGYRGLSMTGSSLGRIKAMVLSLNVAEISEFITNSLQTSDGRSSIRKDLMGFAEAKGVQL